jgi:hypothetical protein
MMPSRDPYARNQALWISGLDQFRQSADDRCAREAEIGSAPASARDSQLPVGIQLK